MKNNWEYELSPFVSEAVFDRKYSQFTIDFAQNEVAKEAIDNDQMCALHYRIGNVLDVIDKNLPDFDWFTRLEKFVDNVCNQYRNEEKFINVLLKYQPDKVAIRLDESLN